MADLPPSPNRRPGRFHHQRHQSDKSLVRYYAVARLLCSHFIAFFCAWQLGFLHSQMKRMPCIHRQRSNGTGLPPATIRSQIRIQSPRSDINSTFYPPAYIPPKASKTVASTLSSVLAGITTVDYDEFIGKFDLGAPLQGISHPRDLKPTAGSSQVLMLYQTQSELPWQLSSDNPFKDDMGRTPSVHNATGRCRTIKHIITSLGQINERNGQTCLAIVGRNVDSSHMTKWIRSHGPYPDIHPFMDKNLSSPFVQSSRYEFLDKYSRFNGHIKDVPRIERTRTSLDVTQTIVGALEEAMSELQPIADRVAQAGEWTVQGTLVIMVCNFGHAEIFANFVCAARSNGVDLSKVLLFATDEETMRLGQSLNITTYYHEQLFASIPRDAAYTYGDNNYAKIMMSKALASHLASETGYDFIFQDVDVLPYSPLYWAWWAAKKSGDFDLYFQEDFNGRAEYAPWIANSGCYFAKNNARTRYFFASFIWQGDMILSTSSHQAAMHAILSEHASHYGLRIKTLQDDHDKILIGWHYHRTFELMRRVIKTNKTEILSFHMNWNVNKPVKRQFLEQMGDWYLNDVCFPEKTVVDIRTATNATGSSIIDACCSVQPLTRCNYRDKPSIIPCIRSPPFEEGAPSFW